MRADDGGGGGGGGGAVAYSVAFGKAHAKIGRSCCGKNELVARKALAFIGVGLRGARSTAALTETAARSKSRLKRTLVKVVTKGVERELGNEWNRTSSSSQRFSSAFCLTAVKKHR